MPSPDWTIIRLVSWTADYFRGRGIDSARLDAEILIAHALGIRRLDLYLRHDQPLQPEELARVRVLIRRRAEREPVAYITGRREFWSLEFRVTPAVLIPRPETEILVEAALAVLQQAAGAGDTLRVADLGTGSGAVAVALARTYPRACYLATDRSTAALAVAADNAAQLGVADRIRFVAGDWLAPFRYHAFDMIVSNPPYIAAGAIPQLEPEVNRFEPHLALDGSADGLAAIRRIASDGLGCLRPGGRLLMEIGFDQKGAVAALLGALPGYGEIRFHPDFAGIDRVVDVCRGG